MPIKKQIEEACGPWPEPCGGEQEIMHWRKRAEAADQVIAAVRNLAKRWPKVFGGRTVYSEPVRILKAALDDYDNLKGPQKP